jgi:hypothetical protein
MFGSEQGRPAENTPFGDKNENEQGRGKQQHGPVVGQTQAVERR